MNICRSFALALAVMLVVLAAGCSGEKAPTPAAGPTTTVATDPKTTTPKNTVSEETDPVVHAPEAGTISYKEYLALDVEVQQAYYEKFDTADAFFLWLEAAKAEYKAETAPNGTEGNKGEVGSTVPSGSIFVEEGLDDWG